MSAGKQEWETKTIEVGLCLPCAMGDCEVCEGSTHAPCACTALEHRPPEPA